MEKLVNITSQLRDAVAGVIVKAASIRDVLRQSSKEPILLSLCLTLIVGIAIGVRSLPYNWGYQLSEFDPYFHYDVAEYIVENGLTSWFGYHTDRAWYPQGRDIWTTSYPGLPFSTALLYHFLTIMGLQTTVYDVCVAFPVFMAALTCIAVYFLGKEVGGVKAGLLASLFLALSPAYIGRTSLGFFDTENAGILGMTLLFLFYLRSLNPEKRSLNSVAYAILAGLSLGYVFASWGASRYALSLLALSTFLMTLIGRYSRRLLKSYGLAIATSLLIAVSVPKLGLSFLREFESVAAIGVLLILLIKETSLRLETRNGRIIFACVTLLVVASSTLALWSFNIISLPIGKFMSVLNPLRRIDSPLVQSVQEHRPATWSAYFYQFGLLVFLAPLGVYFALQRLTRERLLLVTYLITSLYFSASMIRLTILMAPAICILGSLALVTILNPFANVITQRIFTRRRRLSPRVGRGFSIMLIVCLFTLSFLPLLRGVHSAYSPTTIASSSIPIRANMGDWSESLAWMRENLPEDAVVASWWDYGYWITVMGDKITLADNGTINGTQISRIGQMFMSNETQALAILEEYDVGYVTVFTTIGLAREGQFLFGDEVKWRWMALIGGLNDTALEDTSLTSQIAQAWMQNTQDQSLLRWYESFGKMPIPRSETVLTKLMIHGVFGILPPDHFQLAFASSNDLVFTYRVLYT